MKSLFDLTGKTALITGATSGMAKAIAYQLCYHGATIFALSNDQMECEKCQMEFMNENLQTHFFYCDVTNLNEVDQLWTKIKNLVSKIDILVSCIGIAEPSSFSEINKDSFEKNMQTNLHSAIYLTQKVLPDMVNQKDGALIYLASIAGVRGNKSIGMYGISKAGLIQMVKNLAVEYGPSNIRANCISPGLIDTPFSTSMLKNIEVMEKRLQMTPLRRVGQPNEIAGVAVLLASEAGAFITGQNIIVDGGTVITDGN